MMRNSRINKMTACGGMLVLAAALTALTGCGKIEVISETVKVELGQELSEDPRDYVAADKEDQYEDVVIDLSGVDTNAVGTYEASVTYKDTVYTVTVEVVDTTAPEIDPAELIEVQAGAELTAEDILGTVTDLADVECVITSVNKVAEIAEFKEGMTASADADNGEELTAVELEEEGIYEVTAYAVDASGNRTGAAALVIADATAPALEEESYEITVDASGYETDETDIDEVLTSLHELWNLDSITAADNYKLAEDGVSYEITAAEADVTGTDLVENATLTYTLTDAVGNTAEQEISLKVTYEGLSATTIGKQTGLIKETSSSSGSGSSSSGSSRNSSSGGTNEILYAAGDSITLDAVLVYSSTGGGLPDSPSESNGSSSSNAETYTAGYLDDMAQEIFNLVNQARADAGLSAYTWDSSLAELAKTRAQELITKYSHVRPDGTTVGYCENIAMGQKSANEVHNAWMNSDGHRANILYEEGKRGAIGVYQDSDGTIYFVELFTAN